jgi:hypothetical protein
VIGVVVIFIAVMHFAIPPRRKTASRRAARRIIFDNANPHRPRIEVG